MLRNSETEQNLLKKCWTHVCTAKKPGSPDLVALSFKGCFHGRSLGVMSMTNSKSAIKVDMPAFEWPHASFPELRYPLEENVKENEAEEARCLAEIEDIIYTWGKAGKPV